MALQAAMAMLLSAACNPIVARMSARWAVFHDAIAGQHEATVPVMMVQA